MSLGFILAVFTGFDQSDLGYQSTQTVGDEDEGSQRSVAAVVSQGTEQVPAMVANGLLAHRTATEPAADIGIVAVCEDSRMGKCGRNQVAGPIDAMRLFWFWGVFGAMFV